VRTYDDGVAGDPDRDEAGHRMAEDY